MNDPRMTNNFKDCYGVRVFAAKNQVRGWTCTSEDDAHNTARDYIANPNKPKSHVRAVVYHESTPIAEIIG